MKRALLVRGVREDPKEEDFEDWLAAHAETCAALMVLEEWRMARAMPAFADWLARGAPSDDAGDGTRRGCTSSP